MKKYINVFVLTMVYFSNTLYTMELEDGALHKAILENNEEAVCKILFPLKEDGTRAPRAMNPNEPGKGRNTPLHYACRLNRTWAIALLIHADDIVLNARNQYGKTPLHLVKTDEDALLLLEQGVDHTLTDNNGYSIIQWHRLSSNNYTHIHDTIERFIKEKKQRERKKRAELRALFKSREGKRKKPETEDNEKETCASGCGELLLSTKNGIFATKKPTVTEWLAINLDNPYAPYECSHVIHKRCFIKWSSQKIGKTCPLCRAPVNKKYLSKFTAITEVAVKKRAAIPWEQTEEYQVILEETLLNGNETQDDNSEEDDTQDSESDDDVGAYDYTPYESDDHFHEPDYPDDDEDSDEEDYE